MRGYAGEEGIHDFDIVGRRLVLADPGDNRGVIIELPDHVAQLSSRFFQHHVRVHVVPLEGKVLPGEDASPVEGLVESFAVDVNAHANSVDVSSAEQLHVFFDPS